ncbi:hypothetical protein MCOR25_010565 [Pyricularia grisea]|uniref:diphosphoinositol-polyphosphate diphosphatase n=1 Tax=Pyricularia grisea TaxID=148305 RepID=A0A6P8B054_PYRGI|nr:uncharacterized protein PgNI_07024 [Pyricularia grisea]KAI6350247.1 hypothetical protein MCOR25_010565 [Pyricularia grisea]TLD08227.1 hypothetical protein PgNI_07024 [Pyricularia grisea]
MYSDCNSHDTQMERTMISRRSARSSIEPGEEAKPDFESQTQSKRNSIMEIETTQEFEDCVASTTSIQSGCKLQKSQSMPALYASPYVWLDPMEPSSWGKDGYLKVMTGTGNALKGTDFLQQLEAGLPGDSQKSSRPVNFGMIVPGVYRSGYPQQEHHAFMKDLKLKTVVTLVEKEPPEGFKPFLTSNNIKHHIIAMKGTKKETISLETMQGILNVVLNPKNHPLLVHCNHGKHRTGCVAGVVRKVTGWETDAIIDEYRKFADPKERECDIDYITMFDIADAKLSSIFTRKPLYAQVGPVGMVMLTILVVALFTLSMIKEDVANDWS